MAEVSRILRVRLKTGLYDDLTHRAIAAGYASLADWARYLLIQAGKGEVGSKALETEPPGVEAEQALVTSDDGEPVRSISEPELPYGVTHDEPAPSLTDDEMRELLDREFNQ